MYPQFNEFVIGRPNIFCFFIIHSLKMLNKNGVLAFIIPRDFLNSAYYSKIREYIFLHYKILDVEYSTGDFLETKQEIVIIYIYKIANLITQILL
jgi:adenine-specific DNA-methyltransferase